MEYSGLHKLFSPPYINLIIGVVFFSMGVISTSTGKVWGRFRWVYRAEEPSIFWWAIGCCYLAGACLIGYFMYLGTTVGYPPLW